MRGKKEGKKFSMPDICLEQILSSTIALALKLIGIEMFGRLLSSVNFSPVNRLRGIGNRG